MVPIEKINQVLSSNASIDVNYNTLQYHDQGTLDFLWARPTSRGGTNMTYWGHLLSDTDRATIFIPIFCAMLFSTLSSDPNHWIGYLNKGVTEIIHSVLNDPMNVNKELTMRRVIEYTN